MLPPINHSVELCGSSLRIIPLGEQRNWGIYALTPISYWWDWGLGKGPLILWNIQPAHTATENIQAIRV